MLLIKANTAAVQKFLILQVFFHNDPCHGIHHGTVGGRAHRNPLCLQAYRRVILSRINNDNGNALLLCAQKYVHGNAVKLCFFRIMAPEDNEIRIQPVLRVLPRLVGAIHKRGCLPNTG